MDDATRGYIEQSIDYILAGEVLRDVEWIRHEIPISSMPDLLIGFIVGSIDTFASGICVMAKRPYTKKQKEKDDKEIEALVKRRLPEIVEKIERELHR